MPTYEYRCKDCGEHLEVVQAFTDDTLTECPACGGQLRKVFGNIGITFKGSGFYKTDSRSKKSASKTDSASLSVLLVTSSRSGVPAGVAPFWNSVLIRSMRKFSVVNVMLAGWNAWPASPGISAAAFRLEVVIVYCVAGFRLALGVM